MVMSGYGFAAKNRKIVVIAEIPALFRAHDEGQKNADLQSECEL
jgi:hypothetical protein